MNTKFLAFISTDGRRCLINAELITFVIQTTIIDGDPETTTEINIDGSKYPVLVNASYDDVMKTLTQYFQEKKNSDL